MNNNIIDLNKFKRIQLNVFTTNAENNIFLLFFGGMQTEITTEIDNPLPNFGNKKFKYYAKYNFLFNKKFNDPEYLLPDFLIKEIRILLESIFLEYPDINLHIYTQSFSSEPIIRYINQYNDTRISSIQLAGPIILDINEHIRYRIKDGRIFNFLNNDMESKENIHQSWNNLNNINNYINKTPIKIEIILGDNEIERFKNFALQLASVNNIVISYIKNSGHLPWLPVDYSKNSVEDIKLWEINAEQTQKDFWEILERNILKNNN